MGIFASGEGKVAEFHKNDKEVTLSPHGAGSLRDAGLVDRAMAGGGIAPDCGGRLFGHFPVKAVSIQPDHLARSVGQPVTELVTMTLKDNSLPVRLCIDKLSRRRRDGVHYLEACQQQDQGKDQSLFHGPLLFKDETLAGTVAEPDIRAVFLHDHQGVSPFLHDVETFPVLDGNRCEISLAETGIESGDDELLLG